MTRAAAGIFAAGALAVGALVGGAAVNEQEDSSAPVQAMALQPGESQGPCSVFVPPSVDPCVAAQLTLRDVVLGAFVNASQFKTWRNQNPGEWSRLNAHMAAPACSMAPVGLPQDMLTFYGAALYGITQAYACARGVGPLTWPPANPPLDPKRADKTPPSAPGPITVGP